jgi:hypothetical protein
MKGSELDGTSNTLGDMRNAVIACISLFLGDPDVAGKIGSKIKMNHREICYSELDRVRRMPSSGTGRRVDPVQPPAHFVFSLADFFYPEDGGYTFLRNVGSHKIYMASHPRRRHSS